MRQTGGTRRGTLRVASCCGGAAPMGQKCWLDPLMLPLCGRCRPCSKNAAAVRSKVVLKVFFSTYKDRSHRVFAEPVLPWMVHLVPAYAA